MRILILSHLGYDPKLFQRPQQLANQFARAGHEVFYVGCVGVRNLGALPSSGQHAGTKLSNGGPEAASGPGSLTYRNISFSPFTTRFMTVRQSLAFHQLRGLLKQQFGTVDVDAVMIYHPSLAQLYKRTTRSVIVYDVMDRFDAFHTGSHRNKDAESLMFRNADIVVGGGRSLSEFATSQMRESGRNDEAVCLPSGVDLDHFARTGEKKTETSASRRPRVGYFGAVDERIDWALIADAARLFPEGDFVFVGPCLQPPPPLPTNVILMPAVPYEDLPSVLADFDFASIPFRLTELVRYVSPTKTPEYLAGGKPVVSTAIPDVVSDYGDIVRIVTTPQEFASACREMVASPPSGAGLRQEVARRALTWQGLAGRMLELIQTARSKQ